MTDELEPQLEEVKMLRGLLELVGMDDQGGDVETPIDEDSLFTDDRDTTNLYALRRWVLHWRTEYRIARNILNVSMRCSMEGGAVIYLDPEIIVDLMDAYDELKKQHAALVRQLEGDS